MPDLAAQIRALYRIHGEPGFAAVREAFERSFPGRPLDELNHMLLPVHKETRELAGQVYDTGMQAWFKDGERVE